MVNMQETMQLHVPNMERSVYAGGEHSALFVECPQNQRVVIVLLD